MKKLIFLFFFSYSAFASDIWLMDSNFGAMASRDESQYLPELSFWWQKKFNKTQLFLAGQQIPLDSFHYLSGSRSKKYYSRETLGIGFYKQKIGILSGLFLGIQPGYFIKIKMDLGSRKYLFALEGDEKQKTKKILAGIYSGNPGGIYLAFGRDFQTARGEYFVTIGFELKTGKLSAGVLYKSSRSASRSYFAGYSVSSATNETHTTRKHTVIRSLGIDELVKSGFPIDKAILISKKSRIQQEYFDYLKKLNKTERRKLFLLQKGKAK